MTDDPVHIHSPLVNQTNLGYVQCLRCRVVVKLDKVELPMRCVDPKCPLHRQPG